MGSYGSCLIENSQYPRAQESPPAYAPVAERVSSLGGLPSRLRQLEIRVKTA